MNREDRPRNVSSLSEKKRARRAAAAISPTFLLCRKSKQWPSGVTEIRFESAICVKAAESLGNESGLIQR